MIDFRIPLTSADAIQFDGTFNPTDSVTGMKVGDVELFRFYMQENDNSYYEAKVKKIREDLDGTQHFEIVGELEYKEGE